MLLKYALPMRYARLAGAITLCLAALGTAGIAMAGHDAAFGTASALAARAPPAPPAPPVPPTLTAQPAPPALGAPPAPPALDALPAPSAPPVPPTPPSRVTYARHSIAPMAPPPPTPAAVPPPPAPALAPRPPATPATPPALERAAPPTYPREALSRNVGGTVKVKLLVRADGSVKHVEVVGSTPAGVFDAAAVRAAAQWHFKPGRNGKGRPVESEVMVPLVFDPGH